MPTYDYRCNDCSHQWEGIRKIAEMDAPTHEPCPSCGETGNIGRVLMGAPSFGDPVRLGKIKPDNGFKEVLQKIHSRTPGSQLDQSSTLKGI